MDSAVRRSTCWKLTLMALLAVWAGVLFSGTAYSAASAKDTARQILNVSGVKGGLIVHLNCNDGRLTAELRDGPQYMVHGLDQDVADVKKARAYLQSRANYGKVSADTWDGRRLPYVDNLVNLIVCEGALPVPTREAMRVLCPDGVLCVKTNGRWKTTVKPRPENIDEWTHYMHDSTGNPVSHDDKIGPPRHLQWLGSPLWARHHDNMASMSALVSSGNRIFYIMDEGPTSTMFAPSEWRLITRDAFNGTILWKRNIPRWHTRFWPLKSGPAQLPRRLVCIDDTVYATLGLEAPVSALDAVTGKTIRTYQNTEKTDELIVVDGVLYAVVNSTPPDVDRSNFGAIRSRARGQAWWTEHPEKLVAVETDTGRILWAKETPVLPITLASDGERVCYHDGERVVCLNAKTGSELWQSDPLSRSPKMFSFFGATLIIHENTVLFAGGQTAGMQTQRPLKKEDTLTALDLEDGRTLWQADHPPSGYRSPEDVFAIDDLVWFGETTSGGLSGITRGVDLRTGNVKRKFPPDVDTYWFHHRCHSGRATNNFLLTSRTGIEFIDPKTEHWDINHWIRGGCLYGIMPANGMIYAPPHDCICYPESKQFGFNAVVAGSATNRIPANISELRRLERGPAYNGIDTNTEASKEDWPTYRRDGERSGSIETEMPSTLSRKWQARFEGTLTSPVIAGGCLYVATIDDHTVHAIDAESGKKLWSYKTGGRVDSPPTIYRGRVLFGSADGYVYCLRASDGALAWRYRAAPVDSRLMYQEQLESVWPVHGSVLVKDGTVYCVAGRSRFLDGGLRFLKLDPETGRKVDEVVLDEKDQETGENLQTHVKWLNMPVALPDVLSTDGEYLYMRSQRLTTDGKTEDVAPVSRDRFDVARDQQGEGRHLFSPTGFLDGSWFHRSYWVYGRKFSGGWNGYFLNGKFTPGGRILVMNKENVFGFGRQPRFYRWTTPIEYQLFATDRQDPTSGASGGPSCVAVKKSSSLNPAETPLTLQAWVKADKGNGVVIARGGPYEGYALVIKKGRPEFAITSAKTTRSITGKEKVTGRWVHLAGVLSPDAGMQLYVNGKLAASGKAAGLIAGDPAQAMEIAMDAEGAAGDYSHPFALAGTIDEVRIHHRALGADEIKAAVANPGQKPDGKKLVLSYSFDNGKAKDESGHGNNGTVSAAEVVSGKSGKALKFSGRGEGDPSFALVHRWNTEVPILVRGMVLSNAGEKKLFIAGPPDVVDENDASGRLSDPDVQASLAGQADALQGKAGGLLHVVSATDGETLSKYELSSPPTWDGMAAANGKLYMATMDGRVICFDKK